MQEINFGNLKLKKGAALAPMAGATDKSMRILCENFGAIFTVSEMVSAKALTMGDKKSPHLMASSGLKAPYGIQIFGASADVMGEAAKLICSGAYKAPFNFLDINMGCPAPKITQSGAGSALLRTPQLAGDIAQQVVKSAKEYNIPVSVKMRIGYTNDAQSYTGVEVAKRCEAAGVLLLTVHGRTRQEMYSPGIHEDEIAKIKAAVNIPVLANGDVTSAQGAQSLIKHTNCDGVAIARGALGNPWIFEQINALFNGEEMPPLPSLNRRFEVLKEHIYNMCEHKGEFVAMQQARGLAGRYFNGLKGAAALRRECSGMKFYSDLLSTIEMAYEYQKASHTL